MFSLREPERNSKNAQILRDIGELPSLYEEVCVVDEGDGAESAGVVLRSHPTTVKHTTIKEKLRGGVRRGRLQAHAMKCMTSE